MKKDGIQTRKRKPKNPSAATSKEPKKLSSSYSYLKDGRGTANIIPPSKNIIHLFMLMLLKRFSTARSTYVYLNNFPPTLHKVNHFMGQPRAKRNFGFKRQCEHEDPYLCQNYVFPYHEQALNSLQNHQRRRATSAAITSPTLRRAPRRATRPRSPSP